MKQQAGQVVIILLLIIMVLLSVGISLAGRTLTEVSNSTKIESSSRAFFAAEAGIEQALNKSGAAEGGTTTATFDLDNQAKALVQTTSIPLESNGLEYPPISKKDFAQFWFIDPKSPLESPNHVYRGNSFLLYFGNCEQGAASCSANDDKPAVEVRVILQGNDGSFRAITPSLYYDSKSDRSGIGIGKNGFTFVNSIPGLDSDCSETGIEAAMNADLTSKFYCKVLVTLTPEQKPDNFRLILARIRILYSKGAQKVAIAPYTGATVDSPTAEDTGDGKSLPAQAKEFISVGSAGSSQRALKVFKEDQVAPQFLDYAIFSAGEIEKTY